MGFNYKKLLIFIGLYKYTARSLRMGNTCGLSRGSRGTALISRPWEATLMVTPAGWNTRRTRRVKRSRDILSLAPFRLLAFAGCCIHASPTLALYIYMQPLCNKRGFCSGIKFKYCLKLDILYLL